MRVLIAGGGTGGGVYPALAVVEALKAQHPDAECVWLGSTTGPEREMVARAGLPFEGVPGGPLVGVGARAVLSAAKIAIGAMRARRVVARFRPQAMLSTGGWPTIAPTLACWGRCPILLYMPDVEPSASIRALSRLAARVAVTTEGAARFFRSGQAVVTGYPLRPELLTAAGYGPLGEPLTPPTPASSAGREKAAQRFALAAGVPTLLVMGGSHGARSINRALATWLKALLPDCQIVHISGRLDWEEAQTTATGLPSDLAGRYHLYDYLHGEDMAWALAAADLVVARAGASTLGEFPLFGLPAILVPYPHAWRTQKTNAEALVSQGAAVRLDDERVAFDLGPTALWLLKDEPKRRQMSAAMRSLARPAAAGRIAALIGEAVSG